MKNKTLYPIHPVRCIICGPSNSGKSIFLTNLFLKIFNEIEKLYIYSPSLHQDLYQKLNKCFINYKPTHKIPIILNDEDIDIVGDEIVNNKDFEKSHIEIETYDTIEELKIPQHFGDGGTIILDDLNEKVMNDPRVQAMFKRFRHSN